MKKLIPIAVAAVMLAACGGSTTSSNVAATSNPPAATTPKPVTPHPAATADTNTDLLLPHSTDNEQSYFVGAADITNTGNVGIVVLVTIRFAQVSSRDIADIKTVRIPVHGSRTVKFRIPVTGSQVDQLQASPGYANKGIAGKIRTTIVDTFGRPSA